MNDKTRQQAHEENPQTQPQQGQEAEQQEEDAVSYFDEITNEDSQDSEVKRDEDRELDALNESGNTEDGDATGNQEAAEQQGSRDANDNGEDAIDELRRQKEKLEHGMKANSGRVSALTKKLNEARETIRKLQASGDPDDAMSDDELAALEEDFPEAAKLARAYTQKIRRELQQQLTPIHEAVDHSFETQQQDLIRQQLDAVQQAHPDFQAIAQDPGFKSWVQSQSHGIKALYESDAAEDAIALLDIYKQRSGIAARPSAPQRARRDLSEHAELPRKGASRATADSDDPVEIFNSIT